MCDRIFLSMQENIIEDIRRLKFLGKWKRDLSSSTANNFTWRADVSLNFVLYCVLANLRSERDYEIIDNFFNTKKNKITNI